MAARVAVLLDGGFVTKKLKNLLGYFPTAADVVDLTTRIMRHQRLATCELFRVYYYDAPPLSGAKMNPLSRATYNFGTHPVHTQNKTLQDALALTADVAVRRGDAVFHGWKLRAQTLRELATAARPLSADDLAPDIEQKGVDLRIGLDVASLSVKRIVEVILLVTGDSDLVPAMKFARREGMKVYLDTMDHGVRRPLREHADFVFNSSAGMAPVGRVTGPADTPAP